MGNLLPDWRLQGWPSKSMGMVKFDPQPTLNPWTDRHQIWTTWLSHGRENQCDERVCKPSLELREKILGVFRIYDGGKNLSMGELAPNFVFVVICDVITYFKFGVERFGFSVGWVSNFCHSPLTLTVVLTTLSQYIVRACDERSCGRSTQ